MYSVRYDVKYSVNYKSLYVRRKMIYVQYVWAML